MSRQIAFFAAILVASSLTSLQAQNPVKRAVGDDTDNVLSATAMNPEPTKGATVDASYSIGPDDVLTIDVWKEAEISRTVPVRTDGKISLPLLHDVQAAGLTPVELGAEIAEKLRRVIVNPQVTVIVAQMNSQRIYILGQVLRGGAYPLLPHLTAVQALSGAGFTPFANVKRIYVIRTKTSQKEILPLNFKEAVNERKPQRDIELRSGDTIVVP